MGLIADGSEIVSWVISAVDPSAVGTDEDAVVAPINHEGNPAYRPEHEEKADAPADLHGIHPFLLDERASTIVARISPSILDDYMRHRRGYILRVRGGIIWGRGHLLLVVLRVVCA